MRNESKVWREDPDIDTRISRDRIKQESRIRSFCHNSKTIWAMMVAKASTLPSSISTAFFMALITIILLGALQVRSLPH